MEFTKEELNLILEGIHARINDLNYSIGKWTDEKNSNIDVKWFVKTMDNRIAECKKSIETMNALAAKVLSIRG